MTCMCGDMYCPSCGPAQGNNKCPNCGVWDEDGGCKDPQACKEAISQDEEMRREWEEDRKNPYL